MNKHLKKESKKDRTCLALTFNKITPFKRTVLKCTDKKRPKPQQT